MREKVNRIVNELVGTLKIWWKMLRGMKYVSDFRIEESKVWVSLNQKEDSGAAQIFELELPSFLCCLASKMQGVNYLDQCPKEYSSK